jgi:hypothetical protein
MPPPFPPTDKANTLILQRIFSSMGRGSFKKSYNATKLAVDDGGLYSSLKERIRQILARIRRMTR